MRGTSEPTSLASWSFFLFNWIELFKCKTHNRYHWEVLVGVALLAVTGVLASIAFPNFRLFAWTFPVLAIASIFFSQPIFEKYGQIASVRWIVVIPIINVVVALWLFLLTKDAIGLSANDSAKMELVLPVVPKSISHVDNENSSVEKANDEDAVKSDAELIVYLASRASAKHDRAPAQLAWHFLAGAGSVLEFFPPPERISSVSDDYEALNEDWELVVSDLWRAIGGAQTGETAITANEGTAEDV